MSHWSQSNPDKSLNTLLIGEREIDAITFSRSLEMRTQHGLELSTAVWKAERGLSNKAAWRIQQGSRKTGLCGGYLHHLWMQLKTHDYADKSKKNHSWSSNKTQLNLSCLSATLEG